LRRHGRAGRGAVPSRAAAFSCPVPARRRADAGPAPPAPKPDPVFDAARRAFEALPEGERQRVQEALVWTGDLNGSADGAFGRRTYDAILAYQRRAKAEASGILDERARAALAQAMKRAQEAAGFKVAADPATGS
jgi:peptidoglycan hydrolase-like protein with peptidoglycan-binding domain